MALHLHSTCTSKIVSSLKGILLHAYFAFNNSVTVFALQLHAAITGSVSADDLGLGVGSKLLQSLKQQVVTLASNKGVLKTVQSAAQGALRNGWVLLLPTPEERARALTDLLIESKSKIECFFFKSVHFFFFSLLDSSTFPPCFSSPLCHPSNSPLRRSLVALVILLSMYASLPLSLLLINFPPSCPSIF